jgi:hypothetical protein
MASSRVPLWLMRRPAGSGHAALHLRGEGLAVDGAADARAAQVPVAADLVALAVGLDHAGAGHRLEVGHLGRLLLGLALRIELDDHVVLADLELVAAHLAADAGRALQRAPVGVGRQRHQEVGIVVRHVLGPEAACRSARR